MLLAGLSCGEGPLAPPPRPAPPFELASLAGEPVRLADLSGQIVVIDFWATWCVPCQKQIPVLNAFHGSVRGRDIAVLGVAVDAGGREVVAPFAREHRIAYPVLLGDEKLAFDYGAPGFPALAVVDAAGRIASLHLGVITRQELEAAVEDARRAPGSESEAASAGGA